MYHNASCGTDPFDTSKLDSDATSRWFMGIPRSEGMRIDRIAVAEELGGNEYDRASQRFEDTNNQSAYAHVEVDQADIIADDGMHIFITFPLCIFVDQTTHYVTWKDSYGRIRRIRRDSSTGKQIVGLMNIAPKEIAPRRELASYDDI